MRVHDLGLASLAALTLACGPTAGGGPGDDDDGEGELPECQAGERVCAEGGVALCGDDGTPGDLVESCSGGCSDGTCVQSCGAQGVDKIFVVTTDYRLLRFDPGALPAAGSADGAFQEIGRITCPAGQALDGFGVATPFSMAVDRAGIAWVLYNSGEMFHVGIDDAGCAPTSYEPLQGGFALFGMGFASTSQGADSETLFIAGADGVGASQLGRIDTGSLRVDSIGLMPSDAVNPELTGTGAAELWGYFPGDGLFGDSKVARVDQASGALDHEVPMPMLPGPPRAWAFAQHDGKFYVFITHSDAFAGGDVPAVKVVDPATGSIGSFDTSNVIVGAGVSTCAPSNPVE